MNKIYPITLAPKYIVPFKCYLVFVKGRGWTDGMFRTDEPNGWCHKFAKEFFEEENHGVTHFCELPPNPNTLVIPVSSDAQVDQKKPEQSLRNGTKVKFYLRNVSAKEFHMSKANFEANVKLFDGQTATIVSLATATEIGVLDAEYYDIAFTDGHSVTTLYGISGYHLTPV